MEGRIAFSNQKRTRRSRTSGHFKALENLIKCEKRCPRSSLFAMLQVEIICGNVLLVISPKERKILSRDQEPTDEELLAFLDELMPPEKSAILEKSLRERTDLQHRAALLLRKRDSGAHSVGEIWRRRNLSCPSRQTLSSVILGIADPDLEDYVEFHTQVVGCRICQANFKDLQAAQVTDESSEHRQRRYFESSAGLFRSQASNSD